MVAALALTQGMVGHALHARYRAAERVLVDGRASDAARLRDAARDLLTWRFPDAQEPAAIHPCGTMRTEIELIDLQVSCAVGEDDILRRAREATERLRQVAASQVPPEFRDGFLHRHPVHRDLLALAARLEAT